MGDQINDGGPAFPEKRQVHRAGYATSEFHPVGGMTLRDYFAAKALQGLLSCAGPVIKANDNGTFEYLRGRDALPGLAYEYADAMLKARGA